MSSTVVSFIPVDSLWRIPADAASSAEKLLVACYAGSTEVQINRSYIRPFFIDAGENHEDICCPECGTSIPVDAWQTSMDKCWIEKDRGFDLSAGTVQCCGKKFTPDQLVYSPEQGFAMVSFKVIDPIQTDHQNTAKQLAFCLGIPVRTIIARY
jgi:hypothetical protein